MGVGRLFQDYFVDKDQDHKKSPLLVSCSFTCYKSEGKLWAFKKVISDFSR